MSSVCDGKQRGCNSKGCDLPCFCSAIQFCADARVTRRRRCCSQDIADKSVQHLALTKYVAILTLAPVNRAWGAMRDLCAGREAMARPAGSRNGGAGGFPQRSRRATALLTTLAVLDVCSYFMHCLGARPHSEAYTTV